MGELEWNGSADGPSLGAVLQLVPDLVNADPVTVATKLRDEYGYVVRIPPLHPALDSEVFLVTHPDDVQFILQTDPSRFGPLDVPGTQDFGKVIEDSIVSLSPDGEGDSWTKRTRMVSPEFAERTVHRHVPELAETTLATLAEFQYGADGDPSVPDAARVQTLDGDAIRLLPAMRRLTLRLLGRSLFAADMRAHETEVIDAVDQLRRLFKQRQLDIVTSHVTRHLPEELHLPSWLREPLGDPYIRLDVRGDDQATAAIDRLAHVADDIVRRREHTPLAFDDGLSTWALRPDPVDGDVLSARTLRHEVVGLLIAGHATTSAALTWTLYLLASRPGVQERIRSEAQQTPLFASLNDIRSGEFGTFDPTLDEIDGRAVIEDLQYTQQVWQEALRLYPTLPIFGRTATEPVALGGTHVDAGTHVLISPYVTHRDEAFWPDPSRFDPSRFDPDRVADRHEFAYYPFSGGRHSCLGESIATTEAVVAMGAILTTHRIEFATEGEPGPHLDESGYGPEVSVDSAVNLQPDRDIEVRFVPLDA